MTDTKPNFVVDEYIAPGLRYSEEEIRILRSHPVRYCYLWRDGEESPVSELEVHSFEQRFGAVSIAAEGIGGAETPPPFRRQGYMRHLLARATAGMAQRVNVAFVGDAIEGLYEKFGFHTCLAEGHLTLKLHNFERVHANAGLPPVNRTLRTYHPADLPAIANLYNAAHVHRPWTFVRTPTWNRLVPTETWKPGSTALVLVEGEQLVGYAIFREHFYGWGARAFEVDELAVLDHAAAYQLLAELVQRCWHFRLSEFIVREPLDSMVGFVARQLGCEYHQSFPTTGMMMGAILHRQPLLSTLEPELCRRLPGPELLPEHNNAFPALLQGDLIPNQQMLLRLLLGDWSLADAQAAGLTVPVHLARLCAAWFPGGGTQTLPLPYAHKLDRY